jgi:predicted unusual protein kinase regulating ubiquinone biosynthesis (AarF/ABC1/UbiB family)
MNHKLPTGKLGRAWTGGCTAAKVSGHMLTFYAKRPFLCPDERRRSREKASIQGARALFQGLSLLKGTALKMAQQLSLEMDMLPEAACHELSRAYHQAPPINRALVRQAVQAGLHKAPEQAFKHFDLEAFAAASLGQVHHAVDAGDQHLAVKIQYPGIANTIDNDVSLLRQLLRPMIQSDQLLPTLDEIAARLREEVDYLQEADNLRYFARHLTMAGVRIPEVQPALTCPTVLTTTLMPGRPLDLWLKENPGQQAKDQVADKLNAIVLKGMYELGVIHADPNPGNFIIGDDLTVGLVDFGCIKRLDPGFVEQYRQLAVAAAHYQDDRHFQLLIDMGLVAPELAPETLQEIKPVSGAMAHWFGRLFADERFDFGAHPGMMAEGKAMMRRLHQLRKHLRMNPEFIFLDRTRYGLLRIFEQMGARVKFRNPYEW